MRLVRLLQHAVSAARPSRAPPHGRPHRSQAGAYPVLRDRFTADPAPVVVDDTVCLYVGHDEAKSDEFFRMNEWMAYWSKDLRNWASHGAFMEPADFKARQPSMTDR